MNLSTRFVTLFGLPLITVFAVSCAQPGALLTAPSSLTGAPAAAAVGPSASYDATGTWRFVSTLDGEDPETLITDVTQLANGNLQFLDDDNQLVTLERLSQ